MKSHNVLFEMMLCALFGAILCICSPISVPVGPVPLTLGVFAVMLCAVTLPLRPAMISIVIYLVLGLFLPVFSGGRTGLTAMTGVTGGYIWSYLLMVPVIRVFAAIPMKRRILRYAMTLLGCVLAMGICYLLGTVQFVLISGSTAEHALTVCVIPFLLPDLIKALAAAVLGLVLRGLLDRMGLGIFPEKTARTS